MQSAARLEIEPLADRAGDRRRHGGAQAFLDRPERPLLVPGLGEDEPRRIEAERVDPMAMGRAMIREAAPREDEQQRRLLTHAAEERGKEGEGRGEIAFVRGDDLMQGAAREPALRQMRVEPGDAEAEGGLRAGTAFEPRQGAAQVLEDRRAAKPRRRVLRFEARGLEIGRLERDGFERNGPERSGPRHLRLRHPEPAMREAEWLHDATALSPQYRNK